MRLFHEYTVFHNDGLIEVTVVIWNGDSRKRYTYLLNSRYAFDKFVTWVRKVKTQGKALAVLNKFKVVYENNPDR